MSRTIRIVGNTKAQFKVKTGEWYNLNDVANSLKNFDKDIKKDISDWSGRDAAKIVAAIADNYRAYMNAKRDPLEIANIGLRRGKQIPTTAMGTHHEWFNAPTIYAVPEGNGFRIVIRGKDIIYQEFGTGLPGKKSKYPLASAAKWGITRDNDWLSGPNIIKNYSYINNASLNYEIPTWYDKAIKSHKIPRSLPVWMSPFGIRSGTESGRFVYDAINEYRKALTSGYGSGEHAMRIVDTNVGKGDVYMSKRGINLLVRNRLNKKKR